MGLCVHPALPWSKARQASLWAQAKNSFPRREPPTLLGSRAGARAARIDNYFPPSVHGGEGKQALGIGTSESPLMACSLVRDSGPLT